MSVLGTAFGLAFRNLLRNRRRTSLAVSAISFGVIALILAGGFIEWIFWAMRESAIQGRLGHIQVTRPGYREAGAADPFAYLLPESSEEYHALQRFDHVRLVAPRLRFTGLISRGDATVAFIGEGVDPGKEAELSVDFRIAQGEALADAGPASAILGTGLAANLGVEPGDTVTLLATTETGGLNALEARVAGIFYTSDKVWNESALRIPLGAAQGLLRVSGSHIWALLLDETERTDAVLRDLGAVLAPRRFELTPWHEMADFYRKTVVLFSRQMHVVQAVIGLIIVLGISNVLTMSVLERTSEVGTLMAIGVKRRAVLWLFVAEGVLLGAVAGLAGVAAGIALAELISRIGIPMPPAPGMEEGFTGEILVTWPLVAGSAALALASASVASFYPAWKASRLQIVDALRHTA